jgi:hypothetical protein
LSDDRRLAAARCVFEAQKTFRPFHNEGGECWVKPATLQAMREAEAAFAGEDFARAEHLAAVVLCMMRRDTVKFNANRAAWIARMREARREREKERS